MEQLKSQPNMEQIKIHNQISALGRSVPGIKFGKNIVKHKDFGYDSKTHQLKVIDAGEEDRDAYIQSFEKDCGVYNIISQFIKTGDVSLFHQNEGTYGDISSMPRDDLDPNRAKIQANIALAQLNKKLGTSLTLEQLSKLSKEDLSSMVLKAAESKLPKQEVVPEVKEKVVPEPKKEEVK